MKERPGVGAATANTLKNIQVLSPALMEDYPNEEHSLKEAETEGMQALRRLWAHANGCTGQCKWTAAFLLGLYNGYRFPFNLTSFRALDEELFRDCLLVLIMDSRPSREIHELLEVGNEPFEELAKLWGVEDALRRR
jgi:hypothetical protein